MIARFPSPLRYGSATGRTRLSDIPTEAHSRRATKYGYVPPKANAAFVCAMKEVLQVVDRAFDDTVLPCIDETSTRQTKETGGPAHAVRVPHASGGVSFAQGRAVSKAAAARKMSTSRIALETTCNPTGKPVPVKPTGSDAPGFPVKLNGYV